ncbi:MAG: CapA family protein [Lachnospiraceae bacterium]|nr:CapA family protein [Lachnospiraceae bacterium]
MKKIMAVVCAAPFAVLLLLLTAIAVMEYRKIPSKEAMTGTSMENVVPEIVKHKQPEVVGQEEAAGTPDEIEVPAAGETQPQTSPVAVLELTREAEVLLAGDICIQDYIAGYYDKDGIAGIVSMELRAEMLTADIMLANQEFAFSERGEPMEDKQFTFRVAPRYARMFTDMGMDVVSLANNHALDYGHDALMDSFEALEKEGIRYVGAGENYERAKKLEIIEAGGMKIGILAASRVIPVAEWNAGTARPGMFTTYDPTAILQEIEAGKKNCDVLLVYVHWGEEKAEFPEEYQVNMARQYIDAGADAVIGSHPHVMQGIEYYKDKIIAYSLGNYIFSARTGNTAMLRLTFKEDGTQAAQLVSVDASAFPLDAMPYERQDEFFRYMESISFGITIDEDGRICYTQSK